MRSVGNRAVRNFECYNKEHGASRRAALLRLLPQAAAMVSKMTRPVITEAEADSNQRVGERNSDDTISVHMCLQCQIARSDHQKRPD
jgi:hypothetical protein